MKLKEEVWGKCLNLRTEDQEKLINHEDLGFGEVGKIIKKVYPQHGIVVGEDKKFKVKVCLEEIKRRYSYATVEIEANNEKEAKELAITETKEKADFDDGEEGYWETEDYFVEDIEEI